MTIIRSERFWPESDLRICDVGDGILIAQRGRRYKARAWRLTDELVEFVDLAVHYGFDANWVDGHPSVAYMDGGKKFDIGSHHITFARSTDRRWAFVLGAEAKPPRITAVTFNAKLVDTIHAADVPFRWEHAGGHNVFIEPNDVPLLLAKLHGQELEVLRSRPSRSLPRPALAKQRLTNEMDLEIAFCHHLRSSPVPPRVMEVRPHVEGKYPDLVLDVGDAGMAVVELKFAYAGRAAHSQLNGYLAIPTVQARAGDRPLHGILVARTFDSDLIGEVDRAGKHKALYRYGYDSGLRLECVAGHDLLHNVLSGVGD